MTPTPNNNHMPLCWVHSAALQSHRKSYAYGRIYPLYVPKTLVPFQIMVPKENGITTSSINATLFDAATGKVVTQGLASKLLANGLTVSRYTDYDILIYNPVGAALSNIVEDIGQYWIELSSKPTPSAPIFNAYSEVFTVVNDVNNYLLVEWWNDADTVYEGGRIVYGNDYRNRIYLDSEIAMPEYTLDEEGDDRDGFFFAWKQLSEKHYRFTFLAPEYLCDAIRLIPEADYIRIKSPLLSPYEVDRFESNVEWQEQGYLASVEVEFDSNTVIKKLGAGYIRPASGGGGGGGEAPTPNIVGGFGIGVEKNNDGDTVISVKTAQLVREGQGIGVAADGTLKTEWAEFNQNN